MVRLVKYIGSNPKVEVHPYYYVAANDKWYYTELCNGNTSTFYENSLIEEVTIDEDVLCPSNSIDYMFYGCNNLRKVNKLPNSITDMSYAFYNCVNLEDFNNITMNIVNMDYAFYGCSGLKHFGKIPKSVSSMNSTFRNCTSLLSIDELPKDCNLTEMINTFYIPM